MLKLTNSNSGYFALSIFLFIVSLFLCTVFLFRAFWCFFFFPSFSVWLFSSGLCSFLVEETPSAAQMIIAELQFHSSDSLCWGTVDFCVHRGMRERGLRKRAALCLSHVLLVACSLCVCPWICQTFQNLLAPLLLFLKDLFEWKLSEVDLK